MLLKNLLIYPYTRVLSILKLDLSRTCQSNSKTAQLPTTKKIIKNICSPYIKLGLGQLTFELELSNEMNVYPIKLIQEVIGSYLHKHTAGTTPT